MATVKNGKLEKVTPTRADARPTEINPLIVKTKGVVAVDALARIETVAR